MMNAKRAHSQRQPNTSNSSFSFGCIVEEKKIQKKTMKARSRPQPSFYNLVLLVLLSLLLSSSTVTTTVSALECFDTNEELRLAVQDYFSSRTSSGRRRTDAARRYGYPINEWCVDNIEDFSYVFWNVQEFNNDGGSSDDNESIDKWNTRKAVTMERMFMSSNFDGDISNWDTSNVRNMQLMFYGASEFAGSDLNNWDVSRVRDMRYMFFGAENFEQDLCDWGLQLQFGSQTIVNDMFTGTNCPETEDPILELLGRRRIDPGPFCYACNGLNKGNRCFKSNSELRDAVVEYSLDSSRNSNVARKYGYPINRWCVSEVEDFSHVFDSLEFFNDSLDGWDVSRGITMAGMFFNARRFNGDLSNWDVRNVVDMKAMFKGAARFDNDSIRKWDVSRVITFDSMFEGATRFNGDLGDWDMRTTVSIRSMFKDAESFDGDLRNWDTNSVLWADSAFERARSFRGRGLENWDATSLVDMTSMFRGARSFQEDISSWRPVNVEFAMYAFHRALSFDIDLCSWGNDLRETTMVNQMFTFSGCPRKQSPDLTARIPTPICHRCTNIVDNNCARIGDSCLVDGDCGCSALECTNRECRKQTRFCAGRNDRCDIFENDCCEGLECSANGRCRDIVCSRRNGQCDFDNDCCGGLQCFGGRCLRDNCGDIGDTCRVDSDCCALPCIDGRCSTDDKAGTCSLIGGSCRRGIDCCKDLRCQNTGCRVCKPAGSKCMRNHVCCSMDCRNRKCFGNCKKKNKDCFKNRECCSGNCRVNGKCSGN